MLTIIKMSSIGTDGIRPIMNFEFTFDNSTDLPKGPGYQIGQRIYVIANNSTAINNNTNLIYKYSSGKWIKTSDKATSTTNTITENGSYSIASNIATGVGNIDVNVIGGGVTLIDKTITENGEYLPTEDDATAYSKVIANVPNTYTNQDEGKVVNSGQLIAQTAMPSEITENSTVNTTNYNSVTVNIPSSDFYSSIKVDGRITYDEINRKWLPKTWYGLTGFSAVDIWTDGDNIYYSNNTNHYVLNVSTSTWSTKTWNGLTKFSGNNIWTDGDNIYYSKGTEQYVLNKSTSTWSVKSWNGLSTLADFNGYYIWTDGDNIYFSCSSKQYILDKSTSTWSTKSWNGQAYLYGNNIWTDGDNIYHSNSSLHHVLDKSTDTWSTKTWTGITSFYGSNIWNIHNTTYVSNFTTQGILDKLTSKWTGTTWTGLTSFSASNIWTDGNNYYYNTSSDSYYIPITRKSFPKTTLKPI